MKKWLFPIVAVIMAILIVTPCLAISNNPDKAFTIKSVLAYGNVITTGDMMFLTTFDVEYTILPTETIDDTYLVRLTNGTGTTDYYDAKPYGFFNNGFALGVAAIYISASDATSLGITPSSSFKIWLSGNPLANWVGGTPPSIPSTSIQWNANPTTSSISVTDQEISNAIVTMAKSLQLNWATPTTFTMYQSAPSGSGFILSSQGNAYFSTVVPYITKICPNILPAFNANINVTTTNYSNSAQSAILSTIHGSVLDLSPLAVLLGMPTMLVSSILWIAIMIFLIVMLAQAVKSYKPAMLFSFPLIACGALIGWLPWQGALLLGFLMGVMTWYTFTYEKSIT